MSVHREQAGSLRGCVCRLDITQQFLRVGFYCSFEGRTVDVSVACLLTFQGCLMMNQAQPTRILTWLPDRQFNAGTGLPSHLVVNKPSAPRGSHRHTTDLRIKGDRTLQGRGHVPVRPNTRAVRGCNLL